MFKYKNITGFLALGLLLACSVPKDSVQSVVQPPENYRDIQSDSISAASVPWKSFFPDTELNVLIDRALVNNNDLKIALTNLEMAQLTLSQAKMGNIPTLDLSATAASARLSDNSINGMNTANAFGSHHIEDYNLTARLSWEADIWGKIKSQKAAALAGYLQSDEARKAVQTQIVSSVAKGYYNLLLLDTQLDIAKRNVQLNDSTLTMIKLQFESGQVTSLAVQQAEALKLNAQRLVPFFEQETAIQENALSILIGENPQAIKRLTSLGTLNVSKDLSAGLPSSLLSRRPDVKFQEYALSKANAEIGYARANMYPSLVITAQAGLNSFQASNWFNIPASLFGTVAGGLTQPLFRKKELRTQYELAKLGREKAVINFRQSVLKAVGEVSDALLKIDKLEEQETIASQRAATLKKATINSNLLFKNGLATYLEVITAQGNVLQSELELAALKKARLDAAVDLYRSAGGGWN
ncbi:TolC family protein [Flavobacterium sp. LC2016-01]|uniref:TolC family protein n=1 Tax=Flavobacterium sp. LC2016-01 TaxID=2675876 RepID=UPI0012BA90E3|nr:TolC family protein [Flavobacterium sp. LC2016-01]MTH15839.1 efflux transporter outer membrane subunit [Flavobacterium sp. LC2016-01]